MGWGGASGSGPLPAHHDRRARAPMPHGGIQVTLGTGHRPGLPGVRRRGVAAGLLEQERCRWLFSVCRGRPPRADSARGGEEWRPVSPRAGVLGVPPPRRERSGWPARSSCCGRFVRAAGRHIRGRAGGAGGTRPAGPGWPRRGADRPHGSGGGGGSPRCRPRASPPPPHAAVPPRPEQRVLSALRRSVALARGGIVVRGIVAVDAPSPSPLRHHGEAPRRGGGSVGAAQGGCAGGFFCGLSVTRLAPPTGPSPPLQPAVVGRSLGCGNHRATASAGRGRGAVSQGGRGAGRRAGGTTGGGTQGGGLRQAPGEGRRGASAGRGAGAGRGRRCAQAQGPGGEVQRFRRRILPRPAPHRARTRTRPPTRPTTRRRARAPPGRPPNPCPAPRAVACADATHSARTCTRRQAGCGA